MRKAIGWVLLIVMLIILFAAPDINWKENDNLIIWLGLILAGAIMTGGNQ